MTLLKAVSSVGELLNAPGQYHTTSGHQAYAVIQGLSWHPLVSISQELYFPEGQALFFEVLPPRLTPNAKVIGWGTEEDYYERRLRDYEDWEVAFWREVIQNSRDAGATRIDIECVEDVFVDPETKDSVPCVRSTIRDNGRGMSYDTMMGAFFRRGGSLKSEGSVGGFGDAKNLILTPWYGYRVRSQDAVAVGRHEELFEELTHGGEPFMDGTELTVWMPLQKTTTPEHAEFLIGQSTLSIRFTVNGKRVRAAVPKGKLIEEVDVSVGGEKMGEMLVYHSPRSRTRGLFVRSHGIFMYQRGADDYDFSGAVIVEINAPPVNVFTTKRDNLSYMSTAKATLDRLIQRLSVDPVSALRGTKDIKEYVFKGTGSISVDRGAVSELAAEAAMKADLAKVSRSKKIGAPVKLDAEVVDALGEAIDSALDDESVGDEGPVSRPFRQVVNILLSQPMADTDQTMTAVKMAMWRPDFMVYQHISPWHMPKDMLPESMSNKFHLVIRAWTEICRFLMVQLGMDRPFGVGWGIESEYDRSDRTLKTSGALYAEREGMGWLLINPLEIQVTEHADGNVYRTIGHRFDLSDPRSVERMVALAVHEITHMQGFIPHDEGFASALTHNMEAIFRVAPALKKIVAAVRSSVRQERAAAKSAAPKRLKLSWQKREYQGGFEYLGTLPDAFDGRLLAYVVSANSRSDYIAVVYLSPLVGDDDHDVGTLVATVRGVANAKKFVEIAIGAATVERHGVFGLAGGGTLTDDELLGRVVYRNPKYPQMQVRYEEAYRGLAWTLVVGDRFSEKSSTRVGSGEVRDKVMRAVGNALFALADAGYDWEIGLRR